MPGRERSPTCAPPTGSMRERAAPQVACAADGRHAARLPGRGNSWADSACRHAPVRGQGDGLPAGRVQHPFIVQSHGLSLARQGCGSRARASGVSCSIGLRLAFMMLGSVA